MLYDNKTLFWTVKPFRNNARHPQNAINLETKKYAKTNMLAIFITFQHEKHLIALQYNTYNYGGT